MQEDDSAPSGHADMVEDSSHLRLVEHLDLAEPLADLVGLGGNVDLPHVLVLHLVILYVLQAVPRHVHDAGLACKQHDPTQIDDCSASYFFHCLLLKHLYSGLF